MPQRPVRDAAGADVAALANVAGFEGKTGGVLGLLGSDFKHGLGPQAPGTFLAPYGVPYLAGSGVKGVLRRAAESADPRCAETARQALDLLALLAEECARYPEAELSGAPVEIDGDLVIAVPSDHLVDA